MHQKKRKQRFEFIIIADDVSKTFPTQQARKQTLCQEVIHFTEDAQISINKEKYLQSSKLIKGKVRKRVERSKERSSEKSCHA